MISRPLCARRSAASHAFIHAFVDLLCAHVFVGSKTVAAHRHVSMSTSAPWTPLLTPALNKVWLRVPGSNTHQADEAPAANTAQMMTTTQITIDPIVLGTVFNSFPCDFVQSRKTKRAARKPPSCLLNSATLRRERLVGLPESPPRLVGFFQVPGQFLDMSNRK